MPVMQTGISWTDSTFNPTTGCTKISDGCTNCYAESITQRFGGDFSVVTLHPDRLRQARRFKPIVEPDGSLRPRMVFINSMSDIFHDEIPDAFRHQVFDIIDAMPNTIWQALTKRAMTLRRFVRDRYQGRGVPDNLWLGASVENNTVRGRIGLLRNLKAEVGPFTAFLSVEPLLGPVDLHSYHDIDWLLLGGESGPKARPCRAEWMRQARDEARKYGAAIWLKQWGTPRSNPLVQERMERHGIGVKAAWQMVVDMGLELLPFEKGGATLDGVILRDLPPSYYTIKERLNASVIPPA